MPPDFREQLIAQVEPDEEVSAGREEYRRLLEQVGADISGRRAEVRDIALRIIKGTQRLHLPEALLTNEGLATPDREIVDCRAAIVRLAPGELDGTDYDYRRYSGKDSAHPTRIYPEYDPQTKQFTLTAPDAPGGPGGSFPAWVLRPRNGQPVRARLGDDIVEGVLERGGLTAHIRECLQHFEKKVGDLEVLLPHHWFRRASDTRSPEHPRIQTMYTDGAQIHVMNENSPRGGQPMDAFRPGVVLGGEDFPAYIEDLVHEAHIETDSGEKPVFFQSLTPRCLVTQRDVMSGRVSGAPKQWLRAHRPRRPWDGVHTMGANADVPTATTDSLIRIGNTLTVVSEKSDWKMGG